MNALQMDIKTYFEVGTAINPNCLRVFPQEPKKKLQKFSIGTA